MIYKLRIETVEVLLLMHWLITCRIGSTRSTAIPSAPDKNTYVAIPAHISGPSQVLLKDGGLQITPHVSGELNQRNSQLFGLASVTGISEFEDPATAMDDDVVSQHGDKTSSLYQSVIQTRSAQRASCHARFDVQYALQHLTTSDHIASVGSTAASMAAKAAAAAAAAAMVFPAIDGT